VSAERIDHAAKAREWNDAASGPVPSVNDASALAAIAQVHATLALVEQQRAGNLIAYVASAQEAAVSPEDFAWLEKVAGQIREALGLT